MRVNSLLALLVVIATLPAAVFVCRGRAIQLPQAHASEAALLAERLKYRATLQAQRRETTLTIRLHRRASFAAHQRA